MSSTQESALGRAQSDPDEQETSEWLEALHSVIERDGPERAHFLLEQLVDFTRRSGGHLPYDATTAYINTIPPHLEAKSPGDAELEWRIRSFIRWNAMAIVVRAGKRGGELVATLPVSLLRLRCMTLDSIIFSAVLTTKVAATWCTSRDTLPPAFTRGRFLKEGSKNRNWTASDRKSKVED